MVRTLLGAGCAYSLRQAAFPQLPTEPYSSQNELLPASESDQAGLWNCSLSRAHPSYLRLQTECVLYPGIATSYGRNITNTHTHKHNET